MTLTLPPQPGYTLVPLTTAEDWAPLRPHGTAFEFYDVATNVGRPFDDALWTQLIQSEELQAWRMQPKNTQEPVAYITLCQYALAHQGYVFCPEGWNNTAVSAGLEALSVAVFKSAPTCEDLWVCVPVPEPEDSEDTLLIMGFTYVPASLDKGRRRTFGLSRQVFEAYHEGA